MSKNAGLDRPAGTELYLAYRQSETLGLTDMYVVMRAQSGDPRNLVGAVRERLNEMDASLPLSDVRMMDDVMERAQARPRFLTLLLTLVFGDGAGDCDCGDLWSGVVFGGAAD